MYVIRGAASVKSRLYFRHLASGRQAHDCGLRAIRFLTGSGQNPWN
jgi:hypothetical protein